MPSKRDVLSLLTRDELLAAVSSFDLQVQDRRVKDQLIEALAGSKRATIAAVLADCSRDRLKELCRLLGLDDGGREKAVLVERLTGARKDEPLVRAYAPPAPPSVRPVRERAARGGNGPASGPKAETAEIIPGERLTLQKLEAHLWSAADILRGSIDSSDYKSLALLGCEWVRERAGLMRESGETRAFRGGRAGGHPPMENAPQTR